MRSGAKAVDPRQDRRLHRLAESVAAVAGRERRVDDLVVLAALAARAGAGIERHLVRRGVKHALVVPEDVLRAVAVVDVEIDDGDALGAMAAWAWRAATAALLKKQKPIAVATSA